MKEAASNIAIIGFVSAAFIAPLLLAASCDNDAKIDRYQKLTEGCRMVGTIQGYKVGRDGMPAQEQWECNGIMRTVNAVN